MAQVDRFKGVLSTSIDKINGILAANIDKINGVSLVLRIWRSINTDPTSYQYCAIRESDGTAWSWGQNYEGVLGTNNKTNYSSPVSVVGNYLFSQISVGFEVTSPQSPAYCCCHMHAIRASDGSCWGWGFNDSGQLGDGTRTYTSSPISTLGNRSCIQITGGYCATHFLNGADGSLWSTGYGGWGVLGNNNTSNRSSPVSVYGNHSFIRVSAAYSSGHAVRGDGLCFSWGEYSYGRLGLGTISSEVRTPRSIAGGRVCKDLSEAGLAGIQLKESDGSAWGWGYNYAGSLGVGTLTTYGSPVSVLGNRSYVKVSFTYRNSILLDGDHKMWASGRNDNGWLGVGSAAASISSPMSVLGNITAEAIGALSRSGGVALEEGGVNLWSWGDNEFGHLGVGDTVGRSSPTLVLTPPA